MDEPPESDHLGGHNDARHCTFDEIIEEIVIEQELSGNADQERAFRIVAERIRDGGDQLLMYIGGVGGTGKSHVIKSITKLFERLDRQRELFLGAPTGIAAILIGGYTVHALTMLPDKNRSDFKDLRSMWKYVKYLIIDEVSMISARFMSEISNRLKQAKGKDYRTVDQPFGGVNMIFTGDFGQLKPVRQSALYKHSLVNDPAYRECRDSEGVSTLNGAFLWRLVNAIMLLKERKRHKDDLPYAEMLDRIRVGECHQYRPGSRQDKLSDLDILQKRQLSYIGQHNSAHLQEFHDAPVIVGTRKVKDIINAKMIKHYALEVAESVHLYYSKDFILQQATEGILHDRIWGISSSITEDALGKLPLFPGMKVMVTSNLAISRRVVNGVEGIVCDIKYSTDVDNRRYASVVYVYLSGAGKISPELEEDIVPVFPERSSFKIRVVDSTGTCYRYVSRVQLPLVPAYA